MRTSATQFEPSIPGLMGIKGDPSQAPERRHRAPREDAEFSLIKENGHNTFLMELVKTSQPRIGLGKA